MGPLFSKHVMSLLDKVRYMKTLQVGLTAGLLQWATLVFFLLTVSLYVLLFLKKKLSTVF